MDIIVREPTDRAIFKIGFELGINEWRKFLKKGGYIAVSGNVGGQSSHN